MSVNKTIVKSRGIWIALTVLLASPWIARPAKAAPPLPQNPQEEQSVLENAQERGQEQRDREQEKRERERKEKLEREQEKRDREQERLDRLEELYDDGREALDDDRYDKAESRFEELAAMNGPQTDAALYWKAYAQNKRGKRDAALGSIADLNKRFPQSRWAKDAKALEVELRQSSGQPVHPEKQADDDLRLLAIQGLMNSDPERALPLLEKVLQGSASPKEKDRALFVIAQSGSPKAQDILLRVARGQSNPELQRKAIQSVGLYGGNESRKALADIYRSAQDASVKRAILQSYMLSGSRELLFSVAKTEKDDELRREAIRQLGLVHAPSELGQLYQSETSRENKEAILQAYFLSGDAAKLIEIAQSDKDPELRGTAIRNLGLIGSSQAGDALQQIYQRDTNRENREQVLNALFIQGNAKAIIAIARAEKDPELKKAAVSKLSLMGSKEATDYLMEILEK
jgi:HEAT repeat protein